MLEMLVTHRLAFVSHSCLRGIFRTHDFSQSNCHRNTAQTVATRESERGERGPARGKSDDANREKFKLPLVGGGGIWETATLPIGADVEWYCKK